MFMIRFFPGLMAVLFVSLFMPACQAQNTTTPSVSGAAMKTGGIERLAAKPFAKRLEGEDAPQVLDVRTDGEVAGGTLPQAIAIDVLKPGFAEAASAQLDKAQTVYLYCRSGNRSQRAAAQLQAAGFEHLVELSSGIRGWTAAGMSTVMPGADPAR
jgi:rhodanese-related sulfurtransferase